MSILVIGINHKTAPIAVREKVYFAKDLLSLYLQDLLNGAYVHAAVLISTCNRSELYCDADDISSIKDWFCRQSTLPPAVLEPLLYIYSDEEAVAHIMEVACGLDSMVLGEAQILGQMKEAFSESCTAGGVNTLFHRLFQYVFAIAKEIRTSTAIGACPVSIASAAVHFIRQHYPDFAHSSVAMIGAGDTPALLLRYLKPHLLTPIQIVNRSREKAEILAETFGGEAFELNQLAEVLTQADLVFSATGSIVPLVNKELVAKVMQMRQHKPLVFIDIAVPRDIEPAVADVAAATLYCLDDLKAIIEKNRHGREHAADKAREMIQVKSAAFIHEAHAHEKVVHTIRAYRGQIEEICQTELIKAKQLLLQGIEADRVLDMFAHAFMQKLLHSPSVQLRQAGAEGRFELLRFAKQLFAIPDHEPERL